jgi:hypothetical protein
VLAAATEKPDAAFANDDFANTKVSQYVFLPARVS